LHSRSLHLLPLAPQLRYVSLVSVVDLDYTEVLPFNCITGTQFTHVSALVLVTLVPVVAALTIAIFVSIRKSSSITTKSNFLQLMFLAYPSISRQICLSYRCTHFEDGTASGVSALASDLAIDCSSTEYTNLIIYASVMGMVYCVGVPLALFLSLARHRHILNPPGFEEEPRAIAVRLRKCTKKLVHDPVVLFAMPYRPRFWWYEVFSLFRRFALTSLVLAFPTLESSTIYVLLFSLYSLVLDRELNAHIDGFVATFNNCLNLQILFAVLYMLLADAEMLRGRMAVLFSAVLLTTNLIMMMVMSVAAAHDVHRHRVKDKKLALLHGQILVDKKADKKRFEFAWRELAVAAVGDFDEEGQLWNKERMLAACKKLAASTALPNGRQPTPRQSSKVKNLDALLNDAAEVAPEFHEQLRCIVTEHGGVYNPGPNKSRARAVEKIENDYGGDHTKLVDVVRSSAIFADFKQLTLAVEALLDGGVTPGSVGRGGNKRSPRSSFQASSLQVVQSFRKSKSSSNRSMGSMHGAKFAQSDSMDLQENPVFEPTPTSRSIKSMFSGSMRGSIVRTAVGTNLVVIRVKVKHQRTPSRSALPSTQLLY